MFPDFELYKRREEFRSGFFDTYKRLGSLADSGEKKDNFVEKIESLVEQYNSKIRPVIDSSKNLDDDPGFFLDFSEDTRNFKSFLTSRYEDSKNLVEYKVFLQDVILDVMYESCTSFGLLEIQQLFNYVVSTHMVMDVVGSLKVIEYVNNLYVSEGLSFAQEEVLRKIKDSRAVIDKRVGDLELNAVVYNFVGERFFTYQSGSVPATVDNFVDYMAGV